MTTTHLYRKMQVGRVALLCILLVSSALSYWSLVRAGESQRWVRHTNEVNLHVAELGSAIENMQLAARGFALSANGAFFQSALANRKRADEERLVLRALTADNPDQQRRLASLKSLGRPVAAIDFTNAFAPDTLDAYRAVSRALEQAERVLLSAREARVEEYFLQTIVALGIGSILGMAFLVAAAVLARNDNAKFKQARAESDERIRVLVDGVQDYAIFMLDPQGMVVSWNDGARRIKGYQDTEIIGQNFSRFYPQEDIDLGKPQEELRTAAESGRTEVERWRVRKDGTRFMANLLITAARDSSGKLVGFSEISRDITERRDTEAKYRGLLEAAPDAMVVVDQGGRIVLLNVQAEKQFGYRRDELLGQKVTAIIPEGFAERLIADGTRSAADALAQQIGTGIELQGRRKDGSGFPLEIMLSPLASADGILVTAAIRDITVRKTAEKQLAQIVQELGLKHRLLDSVVEGTADPIYIRDLDDRFVLVNNACAKLFKISVQQMVGMSMREFLPNDSYMSVAANDREVVRAGSTRIVEEQAVIDGSARIFLTTKSPYRDADHKTIGTIGISRDITERRQLDDSRLAELKHDIIVREDAARHLAQMESRYRGLLEAAPEAMVISDHHGRILLVNAQTEKLFGYPREELIGQAVEILVPERFRTQHQAHLTGYHTKPRARSMGESLDLRGLRKDATEFSVEITLSPLESPEGLLVTAVVRDVTERRKFQEHLLQTMSELKRSNDELEQFAYIASHDLQEPLRMVASYTQLLAKRYKGRLDSDADDFIAYAVDGSSRMQQLINDLLAYSRAGANRKKPQKISSEHALLSALSNLHTTIEESGATVTFDALPDVTMDDTQLTQVFQNLIGNAVKYRGTHAPRVHISATTQPGTESIFSVQDNGLGIERQYFEKIFVLFQRLHGRAEFEGTGIGLAICKKMLERRGGRIWVESQVNEGSTFRFAVPQGVEA